MVIDGKKVTERSEAGEAVEKAIIKCLAKNEPVPVGTYFGFELSVEPNSANGTFFGEGSPAVAVLKGNLKYSTEISSNNPLGNMRRIENLTGIQISQKIKKVTQDLEQARSNLERAKEDLAKPFEHAEELEAKIQRLAVVNLELSKNHAFDDDEDEPIPIIDDSLDEDEPTVDESRDDDRNRTGQQQSVKVADAVPVKPVMKQNTVKPKVR
ncbi:MAG: hypothetical protein IK093_12690 [Ruminiclostridium sp.]|nr:hypothetical protein [Ruminiclostridium sp.]